MVKYTCLSVFHHFVGLALKELIYIKIPSSHFPCSYILPVLHDSLSPIFWNGALNFLRMSHQRSLIAMFSKKRMIEIT